jgi:hypothetical protein
MAIVQLRDFSPPATANTTAWYNAVQHLHRQPYCNFVHQWSQSSLLMGGGRYNSQSGIQSLLMGIEGNKNQSG